MNLPTGNVLIWAPGAPHLGLVHHSPLPFVHLPRQLEHAALFGRNANGEVILLSTWRHFSLGTLHGLTLLILTQTCARGTVVIPTLEAKMDTSGYLAKVSEPGVQSPGTI